MFLANDFYQCHSLIKKKQQKKQHKTLLNRKQNEVLNVKV